MAEHWTARSIDDLRYSVVDERAAELFPKEIRTGRFRRYIKERHPVRFMDSGYRNDALFLEIRSPLFVVRQDDDVREFILEANTSLKVLEFAKVKDPFTAFQELSMYLGNQLVKRDAPDEIADEYRIAMHGYDKHSFRHPTRVSHLKP